MPTWDRIIDLLKLIVPAVPTAIVAIWLAWLNNQQELKRNEQYHRLQQADQIQQRTWSVEDRNVSRQWHLADKRTEQKRAYLLEHKRHVVENIKTMLLYSGRVVAHQMALTTALPHNDIENQLNDQLSEVFYHVEVFNDRTLSDEYDGLLELWEHFLGEIRSGRESQINELLSRIKKKAASVTRMMEKIVVDDIQIDDWK